MATSDWFIGVEQETSPGIYASLIAIAANWTLWRFESSSGNYYVAASSAEGCPPPRPLGVGHVLFSGAVMINANINEHDVCGFLCGAQVHLLRAELRIAGERFFRPLGVPFDPLAFDNQRVDFHLKTMRGANQFSTLQDERGIIDLTGLAAMAFLARDRRDPPRNTLVGP